MGRPRKPGYEWMEHCPGLYLAKGRFFVRQKGGTETFIAKATARKAEVLRAYHQLPKADGAAAGELTLEQMLRKYQGSEKYRKLAFTTHRDADMAFRAVLERKSKTGLRFGDLPAGKISIGAWRNYVDAREKESAARAKKELAYVSAAYTWAIEREHVPGPNPCKGVTRPEVKSRDRYVTDEEYAQRYDLAGELGRPDVQGMMELAYLCRLRQNEVLKVTGTSRYITAEGFIAHRGKGSKTQLILWSPRLEAAIKLLREVPRRLPTPNLVVSPHSGRPLTRGAFESGVWQQLREEAGKRKHATDWHFHDLKAKGVSDFEGDKHKASGHRTQQMTAIYDRALEKVRSTR